jgi:hypothetical protein
LFSIQVKSTSLGLALTSHISLVLPSISRKVIEHSGLSAHNKTHNIQ